MLIDGQLVDGEGETLIAQSPSTEDVLTQVRGASLQQVAQATQAARRAFATTEWSRNGEIRKAALHRLADLFEENAQEMTDSIIEDVGAVVSVAGPLQLGQGIRFLRWNADMATKDRTSRPEDTAPPMPSASLVRKVPAGVVAAIAPYNYPIFMAAAKLGAALAAGCTVVLLPSAQTMLSTLILGRLVREAGFPDGVVNVLAGGVDVAQALCQSGEVDRITFTGSTPIGRIVMAQAASSLKGVVLELGGKSAAIVLPDADLERIIQPLHYRYIRNSGQACQASTRLLVPEALKDRFIELTRRMYETVVVGDPRSESSVMGPVISAAHRDKIEAYVESALAEGGYIIAGGGRPPIDKGFYVNPTLIGGVTNDAKVCREEIFGPVAAVMFYATVEEAIAIANETEMGLAGSVWGSDLDTCIDVARQIKAGTVTINGGGPIRCDVPICGWKQSGIGREFGEDGIEAFFETQHIQWAL
ncbi:aldehyde dehydrogenase family protein [Novosphingobium malaysiense]|uniref:aldehyde dehydrogenase family protein n=1 Tax=Novosphingobium malaysiense TaxID=1348853 RepID=UPI00068C33FD|nr:aldehyde dehydrogenase family protein [Novosphingobium malaysiense]